MLRGIAKNRLVWICLLLACAAPALSHTLSINGNRIYLDGRRGEILYRSDGDLDQDAKREVVLVAIVPQHPYGAIVVARPHNGGYLVISSQDIGSYVARADITDINGDGRLEIIERYCSGDGHPICEVYVLRANRLVQMGDFHATRFVDLTGDGVPEVLSTSAMSFMFAGDHWLTIYKWNGKGYTDVSRRFPKQYDRVIRDLKHTIYQLRYTRRFGDRFDISKYSQLFADFYYYLGKAYEYRRMPQEAKIQYAIAYRLQPDDEEKAAAFRRVYRSKSLNSGK